MKKILSIMLLLSLVLVGCYNNADKKRYSSNSERDTVESFGDDGRFGVFYALDELDLYDVKNQKSIDHITNFKDIKPYVYSVGEKGYTKLDYENDKIIQSNKLENFSDLDKQIFKDLERAKKPTRKI